MPILAPAPWHTISVDFLSGFPESLRSRNTDCLVAIDKFTKWVVATPCRRNPTAAEAAQLLIRHVFQTFGLPEVVISDRGSQFTAKTWNEIMRALCIESRLATPRHAQTNGQVERANAVVKRRLIAAVSADGAHWEDALPMATMAINCAVHRSTGVSPYQANFFREPRVPQTMLSSAHLPVPPSRTRVREVLENVRENLLRAAESMSSTQRGLPKGRTFNVGDKVWVSARAFSGQEGPPKLHCAFYGPHRIVKRINANAYQLAGLPAGVHATQNISELRPFEESPERFKTRPRQPVPQPTLVHGQLEWEVEDILAYRRRGPLLEYKIRWKDCPQTSWVTRQQLENAPKLLTRFDKAHGLAAPAPARRRRGRQSRTIANPPPR